VPKRREGVPINPGVLSTASEFWLGKPRPREAGFLPGPRLGDAPNLLRIWGITPSSLSFGWRRAPAIMSFCPRRC